MILRYDPRDITEIRVFDHDHFICRAITTDHPGEQVSLHDIQTARRAHRRALRNQLKQRQATVQEYLPRHPATTPQPIPEPSEPPPGKRRRLLTYMEDKP